MARLTGRRGHTAVVLALPTHAERAGDDGALCGGCAGEVCRFGAAEMHCMGAIMGGMAAQEAIKLLTRQFVPMAGTLIFNSMGLQSSSSVFNF